MSSVANLICPRGIAVVGASDDRYYARNVLNNLLEGGYEPGRIYPVHPTRSTAAGLPCSPDLASVADSVSLVIVATRAEVVPSVITEAGELGIRLALVLADGFAEQGAAGRERQVELAETAVRAGVTIMGPNTSGLLVPKEGTNAWGSGEVGSSLRPGGVSLVFQSSGMLNLAISVAQQRLLGLRAAFSVGNEVGFDAADFIDYLATDPETKVIGALIEGASRPRRLIAALQKARDHDKPVVMLKLGRSERARQNAVAHTGRMVSSGTAWDATLRRLGVIQVRDLDEFLKSVSLFEQLAAYDRLHASNDVPGVALMTISGGDCGLLCDLAEEFQVPLAGLSETTLDQLRGLFGKPDLLGNPLDCENLHKENFEKYADAVDILIADDTVDLVVARMNLPVEPTDDAKKLYADLATRAWRRGKRLAVLSRANEALSPTWYSFFNEIKVPFLPAYGPGLRAVSYLCRWPLERARWSPMTTRGLPELTREVPEGRVATWEETQKVLADAGIPYAPSILVRADDDVREGARQLDYPVAAKMASPVLPHRSDAGGVQLGIDDEVQLVRAVDDLRSLAASQGIELEGVEVQSMAGGEHELLVAITRDASLGPMIVLGSGGILTELESDVAMTPVPLTAADVDQLVERLRAAPLLHGYRGRPPADLEALRQLLVALSTYVAEGGDGIVGLECNPILLGNEGEGVVAVDALLTLATVRGGS